MMTPKAELRLLAALCVVLSLVAFGLGSLISWALYDTWDVTRHSITLLALTALALTAGLGAGRLLRWLTRHLRASTDRGDR